MDEQANKTSQESVSPVLMDEEVEGCRVLLELKDAGMACALSLYPQQKGEAPSAATLLELLEQKGVCVGIAEEAVEDLCRAAQKGRALEGQIVARGEASQPGPDGHIEYFVKVSSDHASFNEDDQGRIDYRNSNLFSNIQPGQEIARIHPPQHGPPGRTVTGEEIPPVPGEPAKPKLGAGVSLCDKGEYILAEMAGRAVLEKGVVSITEDFVVDGDLDLHIGNIDFNGSVHVKRDVLDEFHISARKGIKVDGAVGACRLESGGDVELGSMSGNESGYISCKGNLKATFLNGVYVECYGDVIVQNEIRNSVIKAGGCIRIEKGAIFGGECIALKGIEARTIGSHIGVSTRLKVGVYFPEEDLLQDIRNQLRRATSQVKSIANVLGPLSRKVVDDVIAAATNKRIEVLTKQLEMANAQKAGLEEELKGFQREEHSAANPKINIHHQISPGVFISFGSAFHVNNTQLSGPISMIENTTDEGLRHLPLTPLEIRAEELEKEFLEAQPDDPPSTSDQPSP